MASNINHLSRVRALYKGILKLHRGLPLEMKAIGDQYVKSEFRLHKNSPDQEAKVFMSEWTKYYMTLAKQLSQRKQKQTIGDELSPELLENFREEQVGQLVELLKESCKPKEEES
ncbi:succinate dehydrogenase assembly factor 3, mitochondrial-like [Haliotis cracherodii]|uniref:succinate dehydrogenase assembly factor 3, mitochondrial-like n=1 Tax=Haliotis cracherodii TaxID=6455 RepID=UPI0039ECB0DC